MKNIKLIIFDVGGVIDTFDEIQYISYISKKLNIDPLAFSRLLIPLLDKMEISKISLADTQKALSKEFKVSERRLEWNSAFLRLNKVNKDVVALIAKLSKNYKIAILTNVSRSRHIVKMEQYLEKVKYDRIFTSYELRMHKPEHKIYEFVLKKMDTKPNEAIFVDNLITNIEGAKEVGINSIQFITYPKLVKKLKKLEVKW
jgi:glucose-1-phosphatase